MPDDPPQPLSLLPGLLSGDRRALAQALSLVEDRRPGFRELLRDLGPRLGRAHRVGLTGAPGVGKSTLASALAREARARGRSVAVLAVDPTSPLTGGALLGDRIRMSEHLDDPRVFVRSMASRGATGGVSGAAGDALDVLDAAGFDLVLLETVGAGQVDVDVTAQAETCVVIFAPGAGDGIQAMKSGLMEVADLWVVNKGDDPRSETVRADILQALSLRQGPADIEERVLQVSAWKGEGIKALLDALERRRRAMEEDGSLERLRRQHLRRRLEQAVSELLRPCLAPDSLRAAELVDEVQAGRRTVYGAAEALVREVVARLGGSRGDGA